MNAAHFFVVTPKSDDLRRQIAELAERGDVRPIIARTLPLAEAGAYGPVPTPHRPCKTVLVIRP